MKVLNVPKPSGISAVGLRWPDVEQLDVEQLDVEQLDVEQLDVEQLDVEQLDVEQLDVGRYTNYRNARSDMRHHK
ncbi:hypothetical protein ACHAQC_009870 [Fusarium culmorum]